MDKVLEYRKKPKSLTRHYIAAYILGVPLVAMCYFPLAMMILFAEAVYHKPSFVTYVLEFPFLYLPDSWIKWLDTVVRDAAIGLLACNGIFWGIVIISIGVAIFKYCDPGENAEKA